MLSWNSAENHFEDLPNEILLLICGYLSSTEVLYSFEGLNHRLTQMISGYFRHVVIAQLPHQQFTSICSSILPRIGSFVTSLVVSNQWKGILSKLFLDSSAEPMSSRFPNLKDLTCVSFNDQSLTFFLNAIENLRDFHRINLCHLYQLNENSIEYESLLPQVFTANNHRLNSVLFDDDSIVFSLKKMNTVITYPNIQRLSLDLKTINDLHKLLTILPELVSLDVVINKDASKVEMLDWTEPMLNLKSFRLQSFGPIWKLNELISILKRLPSVEHLSIAIETSENQDLMNGENLLPSISSLSLKTFHYFIRFYDSSISIDPETVLSTWQESHRELICFRSDDQKTLVLYTIPFVFSFLILPNSIAKNELFKKHYTPGVKILTLSSPSTTVTETFNIIKTCRNIEHLHLRISGSTPSTFTKETGIYKLSHLTKLAALRDSTIHPDYFSKLLEICPNLYHLEVNYAFLKAFFENPFVCSLLKSRVTHMYLLVTTSTDFDEFLPSIQHLASIFPSLKHFYTCFEKVSESSELLITTILKYLSEWPRLVSLGLVGVQLTQDLSKDHLQQWILQNSTLDQEKSFVVNYTEQTFRLWL